MGGLVSTETHAPKLIGKLAPGETDGMMESFTFVGRVVRFLPEVQDLGGADDAFVAAFGGHRSILLFCVPCVRRTTTA